MKQMKKSFFSILLLLNSCTAFSPAYAADNGLLDSHCQTQAEKEVSATITAESNQLDVNQVALLESHVAYSAAKHAQFAFYVTAPGNSISTAQTSSVHSLKVSNKIHEVGWRYSL